MRQLMMIVIMNLKRMLENDLYSNNIVVNLTIENLEIYGIGPKGF